tara:strand:+ start:42907 stop:43041 length:135 start_codon:yes stop_codon:yes gene_type:complete
MGVLWGGGGGLEEAEGLCPSIRELLKKNSSAVIFVTIWGRICGV